MKSFKLLLTLLVLCSATMVQAQLANTTYSVRMNSLQSYATCATYAGINPRAYLYYSDNANGNVTTQFFQQNGSKIFAGPGAVAHTRTSGASLINTRIYAWEENTGANTSYDVINTAPAFSPDNCLYQATFNSVVNFRNSAAPSNGTYTNTGNIGSSVSPGNIWTLGYTWRYAIGTTAIIPVVSCDNGATAATTPYSASQVPSWTVNLTSGRTYRFITSAAAQIRIYSTNGYDLLATQVTGTSGLTYTAPSTGTFFIELTGGNGRTLVASNGNLKYFEVPAPITVSVSGAATVCQGGTVTLTASASGGLTAPSYSWTRNGTGVGSGSIHNTSTALSVGNYSYTVTVTAGTGCSVTSTVAANVVADPVVTISGAANVCPGGSVTLNANVSGGLGSVTGYNWTRNGSGVGSSSSHATSNTLATGTYSYTVSATQSVSGCAGTSAAVNANVFEIPNATFVSTKVTCIGGNDGTITMTPSGGTGPYQYSIGGVVYQSSNVFTGLSVGTYSLYIKDANNCFRNVGSATILQEDLVAPTALCKLAVTVDLSNVSPASASITPSAIDNGSFDNCSIANYELSQSSFTCANVGAPIAVTLTVTDPDGNSASCATQVTVRDVNAPLALCKSATVELDVLGNGSITPGDVDNGSTDNCGIAIMTVTPSTFKCADQGPNQVTLFMTDVNGNSSSCLTTVTVLDVDIPGEAPRVSCVLGTLNVYLDQVAPPFISRAIITPGMIATDAYDNCGLTLFVSPTSFTCAAKNQLRTVTLTGIDGSGNTATCNTQVRVLDDKPPIPECFEIEIELENQGFGGYVELGVWDLGDGTDNCGIFDLYTWNEEYEDYVDFVEFTCDNLGENEVVLTFIDTDGNESQCTSIVWVYDFEAPVAECIVGLVVYLNEEGNATIVGEDLDNGSYDNLCSIASYVANVTSFTCVQVGPQVVTLTVFDLSGNSSQCIANIVIADSVAPDAICKNMTIQLDEFGNAGIASEDLDGGSTDACGVDFVVASQLTFNCSHVGDNTVMLTVTDVNGNSSTCDATVTVEDVTAPEIICPGDVSVFNDPTVCGAALIFDLVADDACGIATIVNDFNGTSDASDFYPVGTTGVKFTVTDVNGNASNCSFTVEVEDNEPPVITACPADKFRPTAAERCWALVTIESLLATDNCQIESIVNSKNGTSNASGQYDLGITQVDWTVTDIYGNVSTCSTLILVIDNQPPVALCQDITVQLNSSGFAPITADDIDAGSTDNCIIQARNLSTTLLTCEEVGITPVTMTVIDNSGNSAECISQVTVEDNIAPVAQCQDIVVFLDNDGEIVVNATQVNNGSTDACGIASLLLNIDSFTCTDLGDNAVVLTVTDNNGNSSTCPAIITVLDITSPVAVCNDLTVALDSNGAASVTPEQLSSASRDNCDIVTRIATPNTFTCENLGNNTVTVILTDQSNNTSFCFPTVTVIDDIHPDITCPADIAVNTDAGECGAVVIFTGSVTDNCTVVLVETIGGESGDQFPVGTTTVVGRAEDQSGNESFCSFTIEVTDAEAPEAICQDITIALDPTGNAFIVPSQINNGSNDACGIPADGYSLDISSFDCEDIGVNTVTLTVVDNNGNTSTCTAVVTIEDVTSPEARCKNVSLFLNEDGDAILDPIAVNDNSMDACGLLPQCPPGSPAGSCTSGFSLDITYFGCPDVGPNTVTLTVTDVNLNSSSCTATVEVFDQINPIALCQNVTVQLDASGNGSTTAVAVDNGSNDACGIESLVLSQTAFVCAEVGPNTEILTVTDVNGNVSTCETIVTVEDNVAPVAICQDVAITLALGTASITPEDVDNGSNDACGIASLSVSEDTWNCTNIGLHVVTLTVTDVNGNVSTCDATIDVQGTIPEVSIGSSLLPFFCQGGQVILTATSNEPVSFAWSPGAEPTAAIDVFATGTYGVVVTNVNGCTAGTSFYVNYNASGLASSYTIIAYDEVHLHGKGVVIGSGGVGVTAPSGKAKAHENTIVTAPTTFIAAPEIDVTGTSVVANQIIGTPNIPLPVFIENPYASNQGLNVNVPNNASITLSDAVYKKISIGKNAIVTFTQPNIYIQDIKIKEGSRVVFSGCANMIIKKKVDFEKNTKFNLEQQGVTLYVGDVDKSSSKKVVEFDEGVVFYGSVFAVNGEIKSHKGTATNPTQLFGQFIGREVHFKDYTTVNWNTNCDPACSPTPPPACACTGGISKLTVEYSQWDAASPEIGTLRFYSDAGLTNNFATYTNVQAGNIYNVVASSLPGGIFGANLYATLDQNTEVIVIPTACGGDIVGEFFRELFIYSQTDNTGFICSSSQACGPGKTLMCHSPKNKKTPHTHCVKNKDVDKKANKYDWEIGPCPTPEFTARVTETEEDASVVLDGRNNTLVEDRINATVVELDAAPNPFKQSTMIRFRVPQDDQVRLVVFGVTGQEIERLYEGAVEGGREYRFDFQAGNIASGMYFYRLETGDGKVHVKKLIISK